MSEDKKIEIDYAMVGKLLWHKGLGDALKFIADSTKSGLDDMAVEMIDKIADNVFPLDK